MDEVDYSRRLLAFPDGSTWGETVVDPETGGEVPAQVPPLSEDNLYPKERALIGLVAVERLQGRRMLVYVTHIGTRDIAGRRTRSSPVTASASRSLTPTLWHRTGGRCRSPTGRKKGSAP